MVVGKHKVVGTHRVVGMDMVVVSVQFQLQVL
jgi:hypothetical protein